MIKRRVAGEQWWRCALVLMALLVLGSCTFGGVGRWREGGLRFDGIPAMVLPPVAPVVAPATRFLDWFDDDSVLLAVADENERGLYRETKTGQRLRLTAPGTMVNFGQVVRVDGAPGIAWIDDPDGREDLQIWVRPLGGAPALRLTTPGTRNESLMVSPRGDRIAYQSNARNGVDWDVVTQTLDAPYEQQLIFEGDGYWRPIAFSASGRTLLIANYISSSGSRFLLITLATGETREIYTSPANTSISSVLFAPDDRALYFASDAGREFRDLRRLDLMTGDEVVLATHPGAGIERMRLSADGGSLYYVINRDGYSELFRLAVETPAATPERLPVGDGTVITRFGLSPQSERLAFTLHGSTRPARLVYRDKGAGAADKASEPDQGIVPELIRYAVRNSERSTVPVPAFLYRPTSPGPHPVVIDIHGGPERQHRPVYSRRIQHWVQDLGIAVIAPNVRGSSGYGRTWLRLDDGAARVNAVADIGALISWVRQRPDEFDAARIVSYGSSYGGYLALAAQVSFGSYLVGTVSVNGIASLPRFLAGTSPYRQEFRRSEYGDERDPVQRQFLTWLSPETHVAKITDPVLLIDGARDSRVPAAETRRLVTLIRRAGGDVWHLSAMREGHTFRDPHARAWRDHVIDRYLIERLELEGPP